MSQPGDTLELAKDLFRQVELEIDPQRIKIVSKFLDGILKGWFVIHDESGIWNVSKWTPKAVKKWNHLILLSKELLQEEFMVICYFARYQHLVKNLHLQIPNDWGLTLGEIGCLRALRWCQDF